MDGDYFTRWLEGEIGAPVEELANKTALKEYYAHDFEAFAGALVKNKKKLKEGYDPTRREPKEKVRMSIMLRWVNLRRL